MGATNSYVTKVIVAINMALAFGVPKEFIHTLAVHSAWSGQFMFFQPFSYMWIHDGIFHVVVNMFIFWSFGDLLEKILGHARFTIFYFICGVVGAALVALVGTPLPVVGSSIALMGVMTGLAIVEPRAQVLLLFMIPLKIRIVLGLLITFEICALLFLPDSQFSHIGHLSGVVVAFFTWIFGRSVS